MYSVVILFTFYGKNECTDWLLPRYVIRDTLILVINGVIIALMCKALVLI